MYGDSIYWTNTGDGTINAGRLAGGNTYTLVGNQNAPVGLALDGTSLYWANYGDGTIDAAPLGRWQFVRARRRGGRAVRGRGRRHQHLLDHVELGRGRSGGQRRRVPGSAQR